MTILLARGAGDPERIAHVVRILRPSPLDEIADAVVAYAASGGDAVYVERIGDDQYRWSPATRGGAYALMRLLARFLCCDHHDITVGFVTVDGYCIVADPSEPRCPRHVILQSIPVDPRAAADVISGRLPDE